MHLMDTPSRLRIRTATASVVVTEKALSLSLMMVPRKYLMGRLVLA